MQSREDHHSGHGLIACHECDLLHHLQPLPAGGRAHCTRCGALLYRHVPNSLNRTLALNLTALMLFFIANSFPLLTLKLSGRMEENVLLSGSVALFRHGMPELGILVFLTSALFPFLTIVGMLYLLLPLKFGRPAPAAGTVFRWVRAITPWSLVGVFMLGVLVAFIKLLDLADVIPGTAVFALAGLLVAMTAAESNLDHSLLWPPRGHRPPRKAGATTAAAAGLVACHTCHLLITAPPAQAAHHTGAQTPGAPEYRPSLDISACPRCAAPLHSRKRNSIHRTWALLAASALLLIPANVYPVMTVIRFGQGEPNTILGGVVHLIEGGMWPLAMLIFFASIVVPLLKLIVLSLLLITIGRNSSWRPRDRTRLYRVTELVGAWSMVDVFLVGILTALVNLDALATVRPGIGVNFFAAVVVITMFAAHSFDPRLIWDRGAADREVDGEAVQPVLGEVGG